MGNEQLLVDLGKRKEILVGELEKVEEELSSLNAAKEKLNSKVKVLRTKCSDTAKLLLDKCYEELAALENKCDSSSFKRHATILELQEVRDKIFDLQNDIVPFIDEQVCCMAKRFWGYVEKRFEELSERIQVAYEVCEEKMNHTVSKREVIIVPTGKLGIKDVETMEQILYSAELPCVQTLFDTVWNKYTGETFYKNSEWYDNFLRRFSMKLFKALEETNPYGDTFKLTFNNMSFVLELV